jgi:outer membrane protein assembly factor BamB
MKRLWLIGAALAVLAGCSTFMGASEDPPLPGERISILLHQSTLQPDPGAAAAEITLPPPTPNADWPQAGGFANHAMQHLELNAKIQQVWSQNIGSGSNDEERIVAEPIVAGGLVFTLDSENDVSAFDAKTGDEVWTDELTPDDEDDGHFGGGLGYENGQVIVSTGFGHIVALDAKTGKENWRRPLNTPFRSAPTVRGGRVFVISVANQLYVLAADDGRTLWNHTGIEEPASLLGGASPAVDGNVVVVPYSSGELFALRVENGRELWSVSLADTARAGTTTNISQIRGRPIIDRGVVIAISNGGLIAAIDLRTGRRIWERNIGGMENPWVAGDFLYVLSGNSEVVALGRTTGRIHWVQPLQQWEDPEDRTGRIIWTGPVLAGDRLIVAGSNGLALTLSPYSGKVLGEEELPDGVSVPPIIADKSLYFLTDDADLVAYR